MIRKLKRRWFYFKHSLKKLLSYYKHLREKGDFDWDFAFIFYLLEWKLLSMATEIEANKIVVSYRRQVKQLRYGAYLCREIIEADSDCNSERQQLLLKRLTKHITNYVFSWWD